MSKAIRKAVHHPPIVTVGDLIDQLCRLPDTAVVNFRCAMLDQELTFYRIRKRSNDSVEIEVNAYSESPAVVPALQERRHSAQPPSHRNGPLLHKARG